MVSTDPGWGEGHRRASWWRRRWSRTERIGAVVWTLLILLGMWLVWDNLIAVKTVKPVATAAPKKSASAASSQRPPASQILPPPAVSAASAAGAAEKAKAAEVAASRAAAKAADAASVAKQKAAAAKAAKAAIAKADVKPAKPKPSVVTAPPVSAKPAVAGASQSVTAPAVRWTTVGADPCNPKAGCTLEWALGKTGWPEDVQRGLIAKVRGESPDTVAITSGLGGATGPAWEGWMTFGKYTPKYVPHMIAAWTDGQYQPASRWTYAAGSTQYNLYKVRACGNWGGNTSGVNAPVARPPITTPPGQMPLGVIPVVACVEE